MNTPSNAPDTEEIARAAYAIWENEGRPDGRDREHWAQAEQVVQNGASGVNHAEDGDAATDPSGEGDKDHTYVRPAGRKEMDLPVRTWSKTDEEADESFPASDPPGNY